METRKNLLEQYDNVPTSETPLLSPSHNNGTIIQMGPDILQDEMKIMHQTKENIQKLEPVLGVTATAITQQPQTQQSQPTVNGGVGPNTGDDCCLLCCHCCESVIEIADGANVHSNDCCCDGCDCCCCDCDCCDCNCDCDCGDCGDCTIM